MASTVLRTASALSLVFSMNAAWAEDVATKPGFIYRCDDQLCLDGEPFRFVSFNAPELSMRENPYWDVEAAFDQEDIIRTVADFGGQVTRTYVLSIAGTGKEPVHVEAPGQYGEEAFQSLDRALALAGEYDVKVIIPFVDTWEWWGGIPQFTDMYDLQPEEFWTSDVMKDAYKDLVSFVLNRRNTVTGVLYKDDPAIFGWETGNELRAAPADWTMEMAAYIKSIDTNHIVIDGNDEHHDDRVLDDPNIDLITRHYYGSDFRQRFLADLAWTERKRPIIIGEFGLSSLEEIEGVIDAVVEEKTTGALIWSLRNHDSLGGWHWHCEAGGTCAYHVPGFTSGDIYSETAVLELLRVAAWTVRDEPMPTMSAPDVPELLPVSTPLDIGWRGVVGADRYDIARSSDSGASWEVIGTDISDSVNTPELRIRRTFVDPQSGRIHAEALGRILFQDQSAKAGEQVQYRIRAKGPGGESNWSDPRAVTIALNSGVHIISDEDIEAFRTVARFSAPGNLTRIEIKTNADAFSTNSACFPALVSGKEVLEFEVVDAPEVNPQGGTLVTTDGLDVGTDFAIAQPCRGQVSIIGLRYAFGEYDLDSPSIPPRAVPYPIIDYFDGYDGGLEDKWKAHPSGNTSTIAIETEHDNPYLVVEYELGTPNYSGVQYLLQRDNWRGYSGIKFRYRGEGGAENLTVQFRADSGYWETSIAAPTPVWTEFKIPFERFNEPPWSEQGRTLGVVGIAELSFYVGGSSGGSYQIDDIELFEGP